MPNQPPASAQETAQKCYKFSNAELAELYPNGLPCRVHDIYSNADAPKDYPGRFILDVKHGIFGIAIFHKSDWPSANWDQSWPEYLFAEVTPNQVTIEINEPSNTDYAQLRTWRQERG